MTLPHERTRAVLHTAEFLTRISSPYGGGIKGIPSDVRREARALMRHYPTFTDLRMAANTAPEVFGKLEHFDATTQPSTMGDNAAG